MGDRRRNAPRALRPARGDTEDEVNRRLIDVMRRAFRDVLDVSRSERVDLRTASLIRGVGRVKEAKRRPGIFP
jgi:glutamate dehydrogenase (NAD(P)+)